MENQKEPIYWIRQDIDSRRISSLQSVSFNSLFSQIESTDTILIDCDMDSVLSKGKYHSALMETILSHDTISFAGLAPVITIDSEKQVLMQAFLNMEALAGTFKSGFATYFSRSRGKLWVKGESSDNRQEVLKIEYIKSDSCFIYEVKQKKAACHEGYYSCFYRKLNRDGSLEQIDFDRKFIPEKVYG